MEAMEATESSAAAMKSSSSTSSSSVLYKPLNQLTEDDISQLTREDCRRFLKDKGMRRPSWNKSQAIQQVISLKSLLEPNPPPQFPLTTPTVNSNSSSSVKEFSPADNDGSVSAAGPPSTSDVAREGDCPVSTPQNPTLLRQTNAPHLPIGQMTIFYSGKVNVYDGVPVDKARAVMHLAATPIQICQDEPNGGNSMHWNTPRQFPISNAKCNVATHDVATVQSVVTEFEAQTNRQVSLQRYLEKKKDREKFKVKRKSGSSSSGLEMYLNNQMRVPLFSEQISQCKTNSPSQLGISGTVHGPTDKQPKNPVLSVDLNDKA